MRIRRLAGAMFVILALAANTAAMAKTTLTHLAYTNSGPKYPDFMKKMEAEFEKQNPDIDIEVIFGDATKFETMRLGGLPPDIMEIPDYSHLGPLGELVDIMPLMKRDNLVKLVNPAVLKSLTTPMGAVYTVPWQLAINTMYFNRDIFLQGGLTTPERLGDKWNWDSLYQSGKKLTRDKNGDGIPETFGIDRPWGAMWRVLTFQAGGSFYEWDELLQPVRSLWTSAPVVKAIEFNERFYREGLTPHFFPGVDQTQYYFWTGKTAIDMNDGVAIVGSYLKDASFDWDISLMPSGDAGPVTMFNGSGPQILSSTKNLEQTWKWVKFLAFNQENVIEYVRTMGVIPALSSCMSSFPSVAGITNKNYQAFFQQTLYPQPYTQWPVPLEINPRKIDMNPVWQGTVSARTHLQTINEKMQTIIDQKRAATKK